MHIVTLEAENVKRLKAVRISPPPHLVVIGGNNGQGKSSVLDSIAIALGGARSFPDVPVRVGQEFATVLLETETLTIRRVIRPDGKHTLRIQTRDGMRPASPQEMLDQLSGRLTFDPVAFLRLEPAAQRARLLEVLKLDFSQQDAQRANLAQERQDVARECRRLEAALAAGPPIENAPAEPVDVRALMIQARELTSERERIQQLKTGLESMRADLQARERELEAFAKAAEQRERARESATQSCRDAIRSIVERAREDIAEAREYWAQQQAKLKDQARQADLEEARAIVKKEHAAANVAEVAAAVEKAEPAAARIAADEARLAEAIATATDTNARHAAAQARGALQRELQQKLATVAELQAALDHLDKEKADAIQAANFPIPNLKVEPDRITLNGLPLSQASSAEQLRVSIAIAASLNPRLRVMFIRDAAFLDAANLEAVGKLAQEMDVQVWVERVGKGDPQAIVIEDGEVSAPVNQEGPSHG